MCVGRALLLVALAVACNDDRERKEADCDRIEEQIRKAALTRKPPLVVEGVCSNASAPEFAAACDALKKCKAEVDDL